MKIFKTVTFSKSAQAISIRLTIQGFPGVKNFRFRFNFHPSKAQ